MSCVDLSKFIENTRHRESKREREKEEEGEKPSVDASCRLCVIVIVVQWNEIPSFPIFFRGAWSWNDMNSHFSLAKYGK